MHNYMIKACKINYTQKPSQINDTVTFVAYILPN